MALCDVDADHLRNGNQLLADGKADTYADYREVLAREDIDVVRISTPDHWHTKILIEAMLAGKDAYCEKPLTLTIDEGKLIRQVQQQTGRVVQVGTQQRSSFDKFNKALAIIAAGRLGKLQRLVVGIDSGGWSPAIPVVEVPESVGLGSLARDQRPPCRLSLHVRIQRNGTRGEPIPMAIYEFRWWYEYSGGKLTDWGAHHVDIRQLGIEAERSESLVQISISGNGNPSGPIQRWHPTENRSLQHGNRIQCSPSLTPMVTEMIIRHDDRNGVLIEGENGRIFVNRQETGIGKPVGGTC